MSMSIESRNAIEAIRGLKLAMILSRRALYQLPWSIQTQETIDSLEIGFLKQRDAILRSLTPCKRRTVWSRVMWFSERRLLAGVGIIAD